MELSAAPSAIIIWLAAELGFDFTMADNERLKGASRMESLEILLEVGGITADEAEKQRLAELKNNWYVAAISLIGPEGILAGLMGHFVDRRKINHE